MDIAGWIGSAATLATFTCRQGLALRLCALAANAAFIVYGATAHLQPVWMLHIILMPINLWRLSQLLREGPIGRFASNGVTRARGHLRTAFMRPRVIRPRRILRRR